MSGSSYCPMSAVYVHGIAPFSRIQATATEVSRPPENAMPTRSPMGREVRTLLTGRWCHPRSARAGPGGAGGCHLAATGAEHVAGPASPVAGMVGGRSRRLGRALPSADGYG